MTRIFNKSSMKERRQVLRRNMPEAEVILWSRIRQKQIEGFRFRRQYSVGSYVLDFYCPELKLAIEVDGESHFHHDIEEYDKEREDEIKGLGIQILRFENNEIYKNLYGVLQMIDEKIASIKNVN